MNQPASTVVVLVLADPATASRAAHDLQDAADSGRFRADDWVVVEHHDGRVRRHHRSSSRPAAGFVGGALLGGVAGLMVGAVVAPAIVVGSAAAVLTKLTERGIPRADMERIGGALRDGQAALFVLTDANSADLIRRETFAASTVDTYQLHPDDAAAVAEVADEIAAIIDADD
jgi:uncharacterized membrane protein